MPNRYLDTAAEMHLLTLIRRAKQAPDNCVQIFLEVIFFFIMLMKNLLTNQVEFYKIKVKFLRWLDFKFFVDTHIAQICPKRNCEFFIISFWCRYLSPIFFQVVADLLLLRQDLKMFYLEKKKKNHLSNKNKMDLFFNFSNTFLKINTYISLIRIKTFMKSLF